MAEKHKFPVASKNTVRLIQSDSSVLFSSLIFFFEKFQALGFAETPLKTSECHCLGVGVTGSCGWELFVFQSGLNLTSGTC